MNDKLLEYEFRLRAALTPNNPAHDQYRLQPGDRVRGAGRINGADWERTTEGVVLYRFPEPRLENGRLVTCIVLAEFDGRAWHYATDDAQFERLPALAET